MVVRFRRSDCAKEMVAHRPACSLSDCTRCPAQPIVPIPIRRANEIVDRISQLLMDGGLWDYTSLSAITASSRVEALHALYIATAQTFQLAALRKSTENQKIADDFLRAAGGIQVQMVSFLLPD